MSEEDPVLEHIRQQQAEHQKRIEAQEEVYASKAYQDELKFVARVCHDFIAVIRTATLYSGRMGEYREKSLVLQSSDDLLQSVLASRSLVQGGLITPVRRELRYVIESAVKLLYVDQQTETQDPLTDTKDRLAFLKANVGSSIDVREDLNLRALHPADAKQFVDELYGAYRDCSAYVHVSRRQIEERLDRAARGQPLGFLQPKDVREIGRLMFRVYDMALTTFFHGMGLPMAGDIFIQILDDQPKWKFHKGKYTAVVSAYFDYKSERNMRKYGEPRPWNPEGWPPQRL